VTRNGSIHVESEGGVTQEDTHHHIVPIYKEYKSGKKGKVQKKE
jgi:hypothetical protein